MVVVGMHRGMVCEAKNLVGKHDNWLVWSWRLRTGNVQANSLPVNIGNKRAQITPSGEIILHMPGPAAKTSRR